MGVALPTLIVLVVIGCGFRSVEAQSFGTKHPSCNQECGHKGVSPGGNAMDQYGDTPKEVKCYHCWDTAIADNCPAAAPHRWDGDDWFGWDTCCDAAYDCSCSTSSTLSGQCTRSEVGDGICQAKCKIPSCGNDGSDCSATGGSPPPPMITPDYCPCCYDEAPALTVKGVQQEKGFCWHCYETPFGGKCKSGHFSAGALLGTYENCCHKVAQDQKTVCPKQPDSKTCNKDHVDPAASGLDGIIDAAGAVVGVVKDAASAINPLSDLKPIEPSCVLKVDACAGSCTFGFRSAKSSLLVEFALELDVHSASRGTATFEGFANGKSLIKGSRDFMKGDSDEFCIPVPGLGLTGLGGISLCIDLDPNQTVGFTIKSEALVELFVGIKVPLLKDYKVPLGSKRASWSCPNIPLIVGCVVGVVLLLGLSCFGYYRFRKAKAARLPSNPLDQASVVIPNVPGQGGATPVGYKVDIVTGAVVTSQV